MNLGKHGIQREKEAVEASSARAGYKAGVSVLRIILFIVIALFISGCALLLGIYRGIVANTPEISDANIMPLGYASFVYDSDGNQIQKLSSVEGNRVSVSISDIPENMQHAIVAIEDSRFYEHNGVDPHGIIRAAMVALSSGFSESQGASTITQQLIKNNVFTDWLSEDRIGRIKRKLQEQVLAVQLEKSLNESGQNAKDVILENYLNTVNFGSGAYGVQTAAQTYFGKDCKDLTLSECAVLAAIPQNPSRYDPRVYPEYNRERMTTVLDHMLEQGYITQTEHDEALADNVYDRIQQTSSDSGTENVYSYFVDELIDQVKTALMKEKGYTEVQATNAIYNGGLNIYSTEDARIQQIMDEEFQNPDNYPATVKYELDWAMTVTKADGTQENYSREMLENYFQEAGDSEFDLLFDSEEEAQSYIDQYKTAVLGEGDTVFAERTDFIPQPQACMTVIEQSTGYVRGIIGGRGTKSGSLTLNRATDSTRQPGSTFKILSTYGPALDMGKLTLADVEVDEPYTYSDGTEVNNSDNAHHGAMTIRNAIRLSNNVIAVKVMTDITTPETGYEYLTRLGFSTLTSSDIVQSLALGGITNGVSNLELTAAYAAIANGGEYIQPVFYTKVTDQKGNVILENTPVSTKVFKQSTAWLLTSAMEDVVTSGTGTNYQLSGMTVAGKTGTTNDYRDHVFVGFTPYYTAGIWSGYDMNIELPADSRVFDSVLWTKIMNRIHEGLDDKDFEMPSSVERLTICSQSGLLAGYGCPTVTEYFDKSTAPTQTCTAHKPIPTPTPTPSVTPTPDESAQSDTSGTDGTAGTQNTANSSGTGGTTGSTGTTGSSGTTGRSGTTGSQTGTASDATTGTENTGAAAGA